MSKNSFMNLSVMPERTFENPYEKEEMHCPDVVCRCYLCGENIYEGEDMYVFPFEIEICNRDKCIREAFEDKFGKYKKTARKAVW